MTAAFCGAEVMKPVGVYHEKNLDAVAASALHTNRKLTDHTSSCLAFLILRVYVARKSVTIVINFY